MSQVPFGSADVLREPAAEAAQSTGGVLSTMFEAIANLILPTQKELITILRTPTPHKITQTFIADSNGCIGKGLDTPDPETIFECPMSAEAWVHRIAVWCPEHHPTSPLNTGQLLCTGTTAGEIIFYLPMEPDQTQIAPMQPIIEGRISAPHLNSGERMVLVGDQLPPGIHIRIDLQLILTTGVTEYTPRGSAPSDLNVTNTRIS